jgi:two-component system sensor histidine kinase ChvG
VVGLGGELLADSSAQAEGIASQAEAPAGERLYADREAGTLGKAAASENWVYRLLRMPGRLARSLFSPPSPALESADYYGANPGRLDGDEVRAALAGRYGAKTRISSGGQVSVTLYSAVPIRAEDGSVRGAVLLSQSTYRVLAELYELRLGVGKLFLFSLAVALAVSLLLALVISRPLKRLSREARGALSGPGLSDATFSSARRPDEIGDLSRALNGLSGELARRLDWADRFSADLAHELKNPIAAVRAGAESLEAETGDGSREREYARIIIEESARMERIVTGLRKLSRIDSEPPLAEEIDLKALLESEREARLALGPAGLRVEARETEGPFVAMADPGLLSVALKCVLDNALSFSAEARARLTCEGRRLFIFIEDNGPGIPEEHLGRVFDRFFSYRAGGDSAEHQGLGLAIAKAAVERCGGRVWAENLRTHGNGAEPVPAEGFRPGYGGARFTIELWARDR